jgi:hypothetical protein
VAYCFELQGNHTMKTNDKTVTYELHARCLSISPKWTRFYYKLSMEDAMRSLQRELEIGHSKYPLDTEWKIVRTDANARPDVLEYVDEEWRVL